MERYRNDLKGINALEYSNLNTDRSAFRGDSAAVGTARAFARHLERLGYSQGSCTMLPKLVLGFLERSGKTPGATGPEDIMAHYLHLQERPHKRRPGGLSGAHIAHHTYALRTFFAWQLQKGGITEDPTSGLSFPGPGRSKRVVPTKEEVRALYGATETHRERALLATFYGLGLRRSEGEKLQLGDIHFGSGLLYVREGKGRKRRAVPMGKSVTEDLRTYILTEREAGTGEKALLCSHRGTGLRGGSMNRIVKQIAERTDIEKDITLHTLRHAIATHLLESGLSVEHVRDFLGHAHLGTTQLYTHIGKEMLWNL